MVSYSRYLVSYVLGLGTDCKSWHTRHCVIPPPLRELRNLYMYFFHFVVRGGEVLNLGLSECWGSVYHLVISSFSFLFKNSQNGLGLTSQLKQALTMQRL